MLDALSIGLGVAQAGLSIFGSKPKVVDNSAKIGAAAYQNVMSRRKTEIMNEYRKRAFERKVEQVYKQFDENFAAANASFQTEQAKYSEQLMSFAFAKEGMLRQLAEAEFKWKWWHILLILFAVWVFFSFVGALILFVKVN